MQLQQMYTNCCAFYDYKLNTIWNEECHPLYVKLTAKKDRRKNPVQSLHESEKTVCCWNFLLVAVTIPNNANCVILMTEMEYEKGACLHWVKPFRTFHSFYTAVTPVILNFHPLHHP